MLLLSDIKRTSSLLLILLLLYVYIYNPYINALGIQSIRLLYPISFIVFVMNYHSFYRMFSLFYRELIILALWIIYTLWRSIGGDSSFVNVSISVFFDCYLLGFSVYLLLRKYNFANNILNLLYINAIVASCISCFLLLVPSARQFVLEHFNAIDEKYSFLLYRCFGLSTGLTFDYSIVQGFALVYCMLYKKSVWNVLLILIFIISILFNARIGIVAPLLTILYLLFGRFRIKYWLTLVFLVALFLMLLQTDFYFDNMVTFSWLEDGYEEILLNLSGDTDGTTLGTLGDMYVYPNTVAGWLWGTGVNVFSLSDGNNSDIGYSIQLMYGGISYLILIFGWLLAVVVSCWRIIPKKYMLIILFIAIFLLFFNYKGSVFASNCIIRVFMLLTICWRIEYLTERKRLIISKQSKRLLIKQNSI